MTKPIQSMIERREYESRDLSAYNEVIITNSTGNLTWIPAWKVAIIIPYQVHR